MNFIIRNKETILGKEFIETYDAMIRSVEGFDYWGRVVPSVSDVTWDSDEATTLIVLDKRNEFYQEMKDFLYESFSDILKDDADIIENVINYQKLRLFEFNTEYPKEHTFNYNVFEVIYWILLTRIKIFKNFF